MTHFITFNLFLANDMSNFLTQLNFLNQGKVAHPNNMASLLMGGQSMTGMNKDDYMQSLKVNFHYILSEKIENYMVHILCSISYGLYHTLYIIWC